MTHNKLTVIITFLNEGIEIRNTLKSIRETIGKRVDILLIDDGSGDGFAYEATAKEFDAVYYKNNVRLGVAASRDLGVSMISSPYFLLLDGHMRFYDNLWQERIVGLLEKENRLLLCCQTRILYKEDDIVKDGPTHAAYGAYIDFTGENQLLSSIWNSKEQKTGENVEEIPCVLGATYACSKKYWKYIKGLEGLRYYGCDEAFMSLKVWLTGGKCKLIKDITVGHIYRTRAPYRIDDNDTVYNKLLIAELLFPDTIKKNIFTRFKQSSLEKFVYASSLLKENKDRIKELQTYFRSICKIDFNSIYQWNLACECNKKDTVLRRISDHLMLHASFSKEPGLFHGKMGIVLFFVHYAQYTGSTNHELFAELLLEEIYRDITFQTPLNFESGLCGIGWGIEYLVQNHFMKGDTDEILEDIDRKVMEYAPLRILKHNVKTGVGGILNYVYMRLLSSRKKNKNNTFDSLFLEELYLVANKYLENNEAGHLSEICRKFVSFITQKEDCPETVPLNSVIPLNNIVNEIESTALGLENGCAGYGLKKLLEA